MSNPSTSVVVYKDPFAPESEPSATPWVRGVFNCGKGLLKIEFDPQTRTLVLNGTAGLMKIESVLNFSVARIEGGERLGQR